MGIISGTKYTGSPLNTPGRGGLGKGGPSVSGTTGATTISNVYLPGPKEIGSTPKSVPGKQYTSSPLNPKK